MSIDKESDGLPHVDVHRRTTKVNLWMIVGILVFFVAVAMWAIRTARESASPTGERPAAAEKK